MIATILASLLYAAAFVILTAPHLGKCELSAHLLACLALLSSYAAEQAGRHAFLAILLPTSRAACSAICVDLTNTHSSRAASRTSPPNTS